MCLSTQRVRLRRPRLRKKSGGQGAEVTVPAYEAMQSELGLREKLCAILMSGVSTRNYERVVPEMAESCGVGKSAVSREFVAASAEQLRALCERRFDDLELLVIYLDGVQFGQHHVIAAMTDTAYRLEAEEGMAKLKQLSVSEAMQRLRQARRLETEQPSAVATVP